MIDKIRILKTLILVFALALILSSCLGIHDIDSEYAYTDRLVDGHSVDSDNVVFGLEQIQSSQELSALQEDSVVIPIRLEVVDHSIVTIFVNHGSILRILVLDNKGNEMDALPDGYDVRWSIDEGSEVYIDFEANIGSIGINAFITGNQETTEHFLITAQLYGSADGESLHSIPIADAIVIFEVTVEYKYYPKYIFILDTEGLFSRIMMFHVGPFYEFGNTYPATGRGSEWYSYPITFSSTGRMIINTYGSLLYSIGEQDHIIKEITGDLWDKFGIQAFVYGGDITLVSQRGILSQIVELYEDNFYFGLIEDSGFELQYILYQEIPESNLLRLLGDSMCRRFIWHNQNI